MINIKKNNLFICATEQSGDNIGAKIIHQLNHNKNNYIFDGVGGNKMMNLLNKQYYSLKNFLVANKDIKMYSYSYSIL